MSHLHLPTSAQHWYSISFSDFHHISGDMKIDLETNFVEKNYWSKRLASFKPKNLANQTFVSNKQMYKFSFCKIFCWPHQTVSVKNKWICFFAENNYWE